MGGEHVEKGGERVGLRVEFGGGGGGGGGGEFVGGREWGGEHTMRSSLLNSFGKTQTQSLVRRTAFSELNALWVLLFNPITQQLVELCDNQRPNCVGRNVKITFPRRLC